jgi:TonB family protein
MDRIRNALLACCILLAASACFGQNPPQPAPSAAYTLVVSLPSYPDSEQGLGKLLGDMTKRIKEGDTVTLAAYAKSLALPNADAWFVSVFGSNLGPQYAAASEKQRSAVATLVLAMLAAQVKQGGTRIEAHKFEASCDPFASDKEYPLLLKRDHPAPLYDARFWNGPTSPFIWSYFAYVDGGFRYVGDLSVQISPPPVKQAGQETPAIIHVEGEVQAKRIISQKMPAYPPEARQAHLQGKVLIHAVIGKDGLVRQADVIQGVCILTEAALTAVKEWRYAPTLLEDGDLAEVDTTITVTFTLDEQ